jgi:quinol monooxygenase YgiN
MDGGIVATPTDDRRDLLTVIAYMKAAPGKEAELKAALEALVEPTSKEAGYVNYDLHQSVDDPGAFFFYENWESPEHLDAHLATPHLTHFAAIAGSLLDDSGLTINKVRRIA